MNCSFMGMYRLIHDINKALKNTNFQRVEVCKDFFKDLEKVFDEVAEAVTWHSMFESMKEDDG